MNTSLLWLENWWPLIAVVYAACGLLLILGGAIYWFVQARRFVMQEHLPIDDKTHPVAPEPPRPIQCKRLLLFYGVLIGFWVVIPGTVGFSLTIPIFGGESETVIYFFALFLMGISSLGAWWFVRIRLAEHRYLARWGTLLWAEVRAYQGQRVFGDDAPPLSAAYFYKFEHEGQVFANRCPIGMVPHRTPPTKILIACNRYNPALNWPFELLAYRIRSVNLPSVITPDFIFSFKPIRQVSQVAEHLRVFEDAK